ncbi:MAG: FeoB-associated Cys-rich membrane protein [Clostridia bacterium]|nr:FeoB-associated Cys-rich membrane protein [Clostridia bacterium]
MFAWIAENVTTVIALAGLFAVVGIAVFSIVKDKKKKQKSGGCTGNCATCGMGCSYNKKN